MSVRPATDVWRKARDLGLAVVCAISLAAAGCTVSAMSHSTLAARSAAAGCEALGTFALPEGAVTKAELVPAGSFTPLAATSAGAPQSFEVKQAFCRIAARLRPSSDSDIGIELWMPERGWNGKLQSVGNGAFSGAINYAGMATALGRGYAAASTDTGHSGGGAAWALGHPEKVIDFGWRAVHEMTVVSKQLIAAYYDKGPRYSYWNGCSAGGRQGMQEAQRFPADYDGIIAGAPGLDWTGRAAQASRIARMLEADERARLPEAARKQLHEKVLAACDAIDGVADGLLENPQRCTFDPALLECKGSDESSCLTASQVATARAIYDSPPNTRTKRPIPGLARGSELGWTDLGWTASARATGLDQFRYIVFGDPKWSVQAFDFASDLAKAEAVDANTLNALNPDIGPFITRGGKLLQYHGWSDPQISPFVSPQYYERVLQTVGAGKVSDSYRLFMAPGMGHCGGGEGPNTFDMLSALERWVEDGQAPDRIVASRRVSGTPPRTRPLCSYPSVAVYRGSGDIDDEASFVCK